MIILPNNLNIQGMYVIRDTKTDNVMTGAKGQYMFDSAVAPRRSVVHAGWFTQWQFREYLRGIGHSYEIDQLEDAEEELTRLRIETDEDTGYGSPIQKHIQTLSNKLRAFGSRFDDKYEAFAKKNTFAKQTRFVVEKVVHLVSRPIPKKGK